MNWKAFWVVLFGIPAVFALIGLWGYLSERMGDAFGFIGFFAMLIGPFVFIGALTAGIALRGEEPTEVRTVTLQEIEESEDD